MKQLCKRSLALLMVLVMVIGLLPAITFQTEAASYTYNWGTRGTVADEDDFTRSTAEEWYAAEGTSYEKLSQLSGSATSSSVPTSALYRELRSLMSGAATTTTSYEKIKDLCMYTDCQNGGGAISSFYSGTSVGPTWDGSWNREHTWPNSKGDNNGSGENDIFMLRPTSYEENSSRGNDAYGEGSSYYHPNEESGGKYDLRGDVVRIIMFVYVRWQNIPNGSAGVLYGTNGVIENRDVMLKWMEEDPVDTWELGRNDACQSITGTRNVFVDYPELGFQLFGADVPDNYQSPSGGASTPSYTITATSNNTSYGTVSLSGKTITATPKTGYYVSGYTVTSGSATVTQSGNTFTVSASSNCTIRINFAAKKTVTVSFAGADVTSKTGYAGESMSLPSVTAPEGFTFLGWTASKLSEDTTEKPSYYTGSFTPTASTTLYALYSYMDENSTGGNGNYVKVTKAPADWSGEYVIVYESGSVIFDSSLSTLDANNNNQSVTISNNTISADAGDPYKVVIAAVNGGYSIKTASGYYIGATGNSNSLNSSKSTVYTNTLSMNSDGSVNVVGSGGAYLRYNTSASRFRYYKSSTYTGQKAIALYIKDGSAGTTYYTTSIGCSHDDKTAVNVPPTLTQQGYTQYVCADCGEVLDKKDYVNAFDVAWNIVLEDDLTVNFQIKVHEALQNTLQAKVTFDGKTDSCTGSCTASVNVAAAQMADQITIEFTDGTESVSRTYTVKAYADTILADANQSQYHQLVKDMLSYGAAAQTYFSYHTENLVNAGITGAGTAEVPEAAGSEVSVIGQAEGICFYGATLLFRNKIAIRYYFTVTGDIADYTFTASGKVYKPVQKGDYYYIEVADINPQDLDGSMTVVVNDALSVSYSPMNYIVRMSQNGSGSLKALLKAMYNYHLAAKNLTA